MRHRDILSEIFTNIISEKQAVELFDETFSRYHSGELTEIPSAYLCLSEEEISALVVGGVSYKALANWRYNGWPDYCKICEHKLVDKNWEAIGKIVHNGQTLRDIVIDFNCSAKFNI